LSVVRINCATGRQSSSVLFQRCMRGRVLPNSSPRSGCAANFLGVPYPVQEVLPGGVGDKTCPQLRCAAIISGAFPFLIKICITSPGVPKRRAICWRFFGIDCRSVSGADRRFHVLDLLRDRHGMIASRQRLEGEPQKSLKREMDVFSAGVFD